MGIKDATKEVVGLENVLIEELKVANAISNSIEPMLTSHSPTDYLQKQRPSSHSGSS